MEGRPALHGAQKLTWTEIDASPAPFAIEVVIHELMTSFLRQGGDLRQPTELRFTTEMAGPEGAESERLFVRLHGWGRTRPSTSATSASSAS